MVILRKEIEKIRKIPRSHSILKSQTFKHTIQSFHKGTNLQLGRGTYCYEHYTGIALLLTQM